MTHLTDDESLSSIFGFGQKKIDNTQPKTRYIEEFTRRYSESKIDLDFCKKTIHTHSAVLGIKAYLKGILNADNVNTSLPSIPLMLQDLSLSSKQRHRLERFLSRAKDAIANGKKLPLLVISGPDGFGKMTLINFIEREFCFTFKAYTDEVDLQQHLDLHKDMAHSLMNHVSGFLFDTSSQYLRSSTGLHVISEQAFNYHRNAQPGELVVLNSRDYFLSTACGTIGPVPEDYGYVPEAFEHIRLDDRCYKDRQEVQKLVKVLLKKFGYQGEAPDDLLARFSQSNAAISPANLNAIILQGAKQALVDSTSFTSKHLHLVLNTFVDDHPPKEDVVTVTFPKFGIDEVILAPPLTDHARKIVAKAKALTSLAFDDIRKKNSFVNFDIVGALLKGDPGLGKTMLAKAVAGELGRALFLIDLSRVLSKWIGETEKNLTTAFIKAEASGAVLLLDEVDSLLGARTDVGSHNQRLVVNHLLTLIEDFQGILFMTTNFGTSLDQAIYRRLTDILTFAMPGETEKERILLVHLAGFPLAKDFSARSAVDGIKTTGGLIKNAVVRLFNELLMDTISEVTTKHMRRIIEEVTNENRESGGKYPNSSIGFVGKD